MAEQTKEFEELLKFFDSREAKAVIVGAHAVAYHAKPLSYLACSLKTVAEVLSWT